MSIEAKSYFQKRLQMNAAKEIGISQGHFSQILSGKKRPSLVLALRIERLTKGAVPVNSWLKPERTEGLSE